jgi:hypothetical protein
MKVKEYDVMVMAVEQGIKFGLNRIRKHDIPLVDEDGDHRPEAIEALSDEVMGAVTEWFDFSRPEPEA